MKTTTVLLATLSLLTIATPFAAAEPECFQVYPWSELCEGDVGGFLDGMGVGTVTPCDVKDCVQPPTMECIEVYPWSELCRGDVVGFACYWVECDLSILA